MNGLIADPARWNSLAVLFQVELEVLPEILWAYGTFFWACGGLRSWHFFGLGSLWVGRRQHEGHIHLHGVSVRFVVLDGLLLGVPVRGLSAGFIDDLSERGKKFDLGDVHIVLRLGNLGQIGSEEVAG